MPATLARSTMPVTATTARSASRTTSKHKGRHTGAARFRHVSANDYVLRLDAAIAVAAPLDGAHRELVDALVERDSRVRGDLDEAQIGELPAQCAQLLDQLDVLLGLPVLGEQADR